MSTAREREARDEVTRRAFDYVYSGMAVDTDPDGPARTGAEYDKALDRYAEAVRATTDAAWESRIREACEAGRKEHSLDCLVHVVQNTPDICDCDAKDHNSALSALLARLGIPEEGR